MVEYDPREGKIRARDMTQEENWQLKRALDILFTMIASGSNLTDIQLTANKLADSVEWPYLRKPTVLSFEEAMEQGIDVHKSAFNKETEKKRMEPKEEEE